MLLDRAAERADGFARGQRELVGELIGLWPSAAWSVAGASSAKAWLLAYSSLSELEAHRLVKVAELCAAHPRLAEAVVSGELAVRRAWALARLVTAERAGFVGEVIEPLLGLNDRSTDDEDFVAAVRYWAERVDEQRPVRGEGRHWLALTAVVIVMVRASWIRWWRCGAGWPMPRPSVGGGCGAGCGSGRGPRSTPRSMCRPCWGCGTGPISTAWCTGVTGSPSPAGCWSGCAATPGCWSPSSTARTRSSMPTPGPRRSRPPSAGRSRPGTGAVCSPAAGAHRGTATSTTSNLVRVAGRPGHPTVRCCAGSTTA